MTGRAAAAARAEHLPVPEPYWRVSDVSVLYRGRTALASVTLDIGRHRVTTVIGPSGCGKSSFLYTLNGLAHAIDGCRVTGHIHIGERNILERRFDGTLLRRRVGFIFQKPNPFPLSIRRNLELPLKEHGMRRREDLAENVETALRAVGLWDEVKDRLNAPALLLSGGQQQRLCIARALVLGPDALLMDEPCSALDPIATGVIEELIRSLRQSYTIVIVTHNMRQARRLGDDTALFWWQEGSGRLIETGPTEAMFAEPRTALARRYVSGEIC